MIQILWLYVTVIRPITETTVVLVNHIQIKMLQGSYPVRGNINCSQELQDDHVTAKTHFCAYFVYKVEFQH